MGCRCDKLLHCSQRKGDLHSQHGPQIPLEFLSFSIFCQAPFQMRESALSVGLPVSLSESLPNLTIL